MDTNSINQLTELLNTARLKADLLRVEGSNTTANIAQISTFLLTAIGLILTYLKASSAQTGVKEVHDLVNSKDAHNTEKIEKLEGQVTILTGEKIELKEQAKSNQLTEQVKTQVAQELSKQ